MAVRKQFLDFERALQRLKESFVLAFENKDLYEYLRDSTIQRFEFTVEIGWKSMKLFLLEREGIECRSPKSCIRSMFESGYFDEEMTRSFLAMIDDRNLTTHTYHEELAQMLFEKMRSHIELLEKLLKIVKEYCD